MKIQKKIPPITTLPLLSTQIPQFTSNKKVGNINVKCKTLIMQKDMVEVTKKREQTLNNIN
jgi:hypothetical protein